MLVPLDGSPLAERALPYAVSLVRAAGGQVILLRAEPLQAPPGVHHAEIQLTLSQRAETDLAATADPVRASGVRVEHLVVYDEPAKAITQIARDRSVDLIVMSTHGHSGLGRWVYGSVADEVLRNADRPVLLVPATCEQPWRIGPTDQKRHVLVPVDGSEEAELALGPGALLAQLLQARLLFLRVVEPTQYTFDAEWIFDMSTVPAEKAQAHRYLEELATPFRAHGQVVEVREVIGFAGSTIAAVSYEEGIQVVAMTTHGLAGATRGVMGPVADVVLRSAVVPVLLVRAPSIREAEREAMGPPDHVTVGVRLRRDEVPAVASAIRDLLSDRRIEDEFGVLLRDLSAKLEQLIPAASQSSTKPRPQDCPSPATCQVSP